MSQLFVLSLEGDFESGFKATLEIGEEGDKRPTSETIGELPPKPEMLNFYSDWQSSQLECLKRGRRLKVPSSQTEPVSVKSLIEKSQKKADLLRRNLNNWLNQSEPFRRIRDKLLAKYTSSEEVRVLLRLRNQNATKLVNLRRIPWQLWDLIEEYSMGEVALSNPESEKVAKNNIPTIEDKVRILAIVGNTTGIQSEQDLEFLKQLPRSEIRVIQQPERYQINDELWEQTWDILYFAGHSETLEEVGKIEINQNSPPDTLTIADLKYGLKKAIRHGLQLAIFNSCDGLGLAYQLEDLHIPYIIVMREPVEDKVAREFLKHFLSAFAGGQSLDAAVRDARQWLHGLEDKYPCASWIPVLCQNAASAPLKWSALGRRPTSICPYRGLFAFRKEDAPFFFGRENFTQQLENAVHRERLVTVIGPSGSGKSSAVFAGLIPKLCSQGNWQTLDFRPGDRPFHALAFKLIQHLEPNLESENDRLRETRQLAADLQQEPEALRDVIERIIWNNPGTRFLMVIDQFEELYTLCSKQECQSFLERLLEVVKTVNHYNLHLTLVLTLRADFLGYALSDRSFADVIPVADQMLGPMNPVELEQAITQPAQLFGVTIESGLTELILEEIMPNGKAMEPGYLPLVEFTLTQLWEKQQNAQLGA